MATMNSVEYTAIVRRLEEDGLFAATLRELGQSVVGYGESPADALGNLYRDADDLLELLQEEGKPIPEPEEHFPWMDYSGKATIRMPRSLHYKLHKLAEDEGVSLNTQMVSILAWGAEHKHCMIRPLQPQVHVGNWNQLAFVSPNTDWLAMRQPSEILEKTVTLNEVEPIAAINQFAYSA